eukprot:Gb_40523 [translate_table: standard]
MSQNTLSGILDLSELLLHYLDGLVQTEDIDFKRSGHFLSHEICLRLRNMSGRMLHPLALLKITLLFFMLYGVRINFLNVPRNSPRVYSCELEAPNLPNWTKACMEVILARGSPELDWTRIYLTRSPSDMLEDRFVLMTASLIHAATLDIICVCSTMMGPKNSLTHYALSTPTMKSWRAWLPCSSTDAIFLMNWVVNSPKVVSSSTSEGKELFGFSIGGNPTLFNNVLILHKDDSNCLFDKTSGASPYSSAYLVLARVLSHVITSSNSNSDRLGNKGVLLNSIKREIVNEDPGMLVGIINMGILQMVGLRKSDGGWEDKDVDDVEEIVVVIYMSAREVVLSLDVMHVSYRVTCGGGGMEELDGGKRS